MIDVKQAAEIARAHLVDLLGKQELGDEKGITLEEFELTENKRFWRITLGYPVREKRPAPKPTDEFNRLGALLQEPRKKHKTFTVDTKDGKLVGMKYAEI